MFFNAVTALFSGAGITLALFYVMHLLVWMEPGPALPPRDHPKLAYVRVPEPTPPIKTICRFPSPVEYPDPPPLPKEEWSSTGTSGIAVPHYGPTTPPIDPEKPGSAWTDGPLVVFLRTQPVYPAIAASRGLEGYVLVRFDVGADGLVANVEVLESSDRVFERSAVEAALRFRFKPRVVGGVPVATTGVRNLFRFEME